MGGNEGYGDGGLLCPGPQLRLTGGSEGVR